MNIYVALGVTAVLSFIIAFLLGFVLIPWLRKLKFGQTILDIGPAWHKSKQGNPRRDILWSHSCKITLSSQIMPVVLWWCLIFLPLCV